MGVIRSILLYLIIWGPSIGFAFEEQGCFSREDCAKTEYFLKHLAKHPAGSFEFETPPESIAEAYDRFLELYNKLEAEYKTFEKSELDRYQQFYQSQGSEQFSSKPDKELISEYKSIQTQIKQIKKRIKKQAKRTFSKMNKRGRK